MVSTAYYPQVSADPIRPPAWAPAHAPPGSPASTEDDDMVPVDFVTQTAGGDISITSTSMADIDGSNLDLTLAAAVGDTICCVLSCLSVAASSQTVRFQFLTKDGASENVIYGSLYVGNEPSAYGVSSHVLYVVTADDLSAGNVKIRLQGNTTGSTGTLFRSAANPVTVELWNLGQ